MVKNRCAKRVQWRIKVFIGREFDYPGRSEVVGGDHGGKWETSYLMYLRPNYVDMTVCAGRSSDSHLYGVSENNLREEALFEVGEKAYKIIVDGMIKKQKNCLR